MGCLQLLLILCCTDSSEQKTSRHTRHLFFPPAWFQQQTAASVFTSVPPEPKVSLSVLMSNRPGCCAGEGSATAYKSSTTFPDDTLTFIKSYPLMDESVPSVNDRPYFTRTTSRYKIFLTKWHVKTFRNRFCRPYRSAKRCPAHRWSPVFILWHVSVLKLLMVSIYTVK